MKPESRYFEENNIKLLGVSIPGRTNDGDTLTSISAIVDCLYPDLKRTLMKLKETNPHLEITFFGHSMGAIIAFELARYFQQDIEDEESLLPVITVSRLIVSAARDPYRLSTFNSDPKNLNIMHKSSDDAMVNHAIMIGGLPSGIDPMFLRKTVPVMRRDYEALETYNESRQLWGGTKLSCPLFVFLGDSDGYVEESETKHWNVWTTAISRVKHFRGGHFYFNESYNKLEFLNTLRDLCLPCRLSSPLSYSISSSSEKSSKSFRGIDCGGGGGGVKFSGEDMKSDASERSSQSSKSSNSKGGCCSPPETETETDTCSDSKSSAATNSEESDHSDRRRERSYSIVEHRK